MTKYFSSIFIRGRSWLGTTGGSRSQVKETPPVLSFRASGVKGLRFRV